ncbi:hypothetical protein ZWY2020_006456 [Hordeum vulgare]|nr:hypothetical protein ZWY2020_006456 [Hordeum vulgare]
MPPPPSSSPPRTSLARAAGPPVHTCRSTHESCACAAAVGMDEDDVSGSHGGRGGGCPCLPFCFWGSRVPAAPEGRRRRRRRFRLRLRLRLNLSWLSWPWLRKSKSSEAGGKNKGKRRRKLLLLLLRSLQVKKALASVSSGGSFLPKLQVGGSGGAKKQKRSNPWQKVDDDAAPTTSCAKETGPARPEMISPPFPRPTDGVWRAPSSRFHSLQLDRGSAKPSTGGLWTAATTLGVIVFFGRVTAVFFLCSCMYGARWFGAAQADTRGSIASAGSSRRLGDRVALDYLWAEEHKKKVVMCGLLDRAGGKRPSSRFCI